MTPRSYTQVFFETSTRLEGEVTALGKAVVVTIRTFDNDFRHNIELFVPPANCAAIAQAFESLARELSQVASQAEVQA